jgi:transcriptional regulator with XRE-family HTH domain
VTAPADSSPTRPRVHSLAVAPTLAELTPTTLRDWRIARGLDVAPLAKQLGVSRSTIYRWERRCRFPVPAHTRALARALGVSARDVSAFFDAARVPNTRLEGVPAAGLRALRKAHVLTGPALARMLGLPSYRVYNWEREASRIKEPELSELTMVFALTVEDLRLCLVQPSPRPALKLSFAPLPRLRRSRGLSQVQAARALGVARSSLRSWEQGAPPPLGQLRNLALLYGVSVATVATASGVRAPGELRPQSWTAGDLPRVLYVLRNWSQISQAELADLCAVSVATIRNWERGRHQPAARNRHRMEAVFRLPRDSVLCAYAYRDSRHTRAQQALEART